MSCTFMRPLFFSPLSAVRPGGLAVVVQPRMCAPRLLPREPPARVHRYRATVCSACFRCTSSFAGATFLLRDCVDSHCVTRPACSPVFVLPTPRRLDHYVFIFGARARARACVRARATAHPRTHARTSGGHCNAPQCVRAHSMEHLVHGMDRSTGWGVQTARNGSIDRLGRAD